MLVVGLGNPLMGDDGVGHAVVEQLRRLLANRQGVRIEHGDTDALRLPSLWHGEKEVWLVDAVRSGAPTGTIHRLDHQALLAVPQRHHHAHRLSLPESLRWMALAVPEMASVGYRFWGIEVQAVAPAEGLTPAVAAAAEQVAAEIAGRLA